MSTDLFGVDTKKQRRGGGGPLVPIDLDNGCPACGYKLERETVHESALIRHGGYGATRSTTTAHCHGCTWHMTVEVSETRPLAASSTCPCTDEG